MALLAVSISFSSCDKEEDDDTKSTVVDDETKVYDDYDDIMRYDFTKQKITVSPGVTYVYSTKEGSATHAEGDFTIDSVATGYVKLTINSKTVELSDTGASYLSISGEPMKQTEAKSNPSSILLCLLSKSTNIAVGTQVVDKEIAAGATPRYFEQKVNF